jgi:hypothetical protein
MALESICPGMFHAEAGEAKGSNGQVSRPRPAFAKVLFWLLSIFRPNLPQTATAHRA